MLSGKDYIKEVKKFTTSHYWNTGVRITAGVMLPTIVLEHFGWLAIGMPFLWGTLFVSMTDTPGPIHHRRNGLIAAIALNTFTVFITASLHDHQFILIGEIVLLTFVFTLFGVFGNRAGAIGTLALTIMLLNLVPHSAHINPITDTVLIFAGGVWYTIFSLLLYRIRPYRLAEQAIGENLIAIAGYMRARAFLYKSEDVGNAFTGVMEEQINVLKSQQQASDILFRTRQFVADASPKSRSMMMIFIDSNDLLEQVMSSHQDYKKVHDSLRDTGLLDEFFNAITSSASELERIGSIIQSGANVRNNVALEEGFVKLALSIEQHKQIVTDPDQVASINALTRSLESLRHIAGLMQRLVQYSRMEIKVFDNYTSIVDANRMVIGQPIEWKIVKENLTLKSNTFRHAIRITAGVLIGYGVVYLFALSHAYWVVLTIVTILKPVYSVSTRRNIQRLSGTLIGAALAFVGIYFISDRAILLGLMIFSMIMSYSLLRVNYLVFVVFLTIYILISFHFLNPAQFTTLIEQRVVDTIVGSIIAGIVARLILPVWGTQEINVSLADMIKAHYNYFNAALIAMGQVDESKDFNLARQAAVVALTNLSDNFQRILSEPRHIPEAEQIHQFVIASHILTGHIAALSQQKISDEFLRTPESKTLITLIRHELGKEFDQLEEQVIPEKNQTAHELSVIYTLSHEIRSLWTKVIAAEKTVTVAK